jgi:hypothetical protein
LKEIPVEAVINTMASDMPVAGADEVSVAKALEEAHRELARVESQRLSDTKVMEGLSAGIAAYFPAAVPVCLWINPGDNATTVTNKLGQFYWEMGRRTDRLKAEIPTESLFVHKISRRSVYRRADVIENVAYDAPPGGLEAMVAQGVNTPWTSSLGRLFDGVASLLGLCQRASYEGEAGLRLQGMAAREAPAEPAGRCATAAATREGSTCCAYPLPLRAAEPGSGADLPLGWLDWQPLLEALLADRAAGAAPGPCAARFHRGLALGLADLLAAAAGETGCRRVVLAGGCFQNALLLEGCIAGLRRAGLAVFWNEQRPCNDGGLALGQLWAALGSAPITTEPGPAAACASPPLG